MNVDLPQEQWNAILLILAEQPYKVSAPLIQGITRQLQDQMQEDNRVQQLRPGA